MVRFVSVILGGAALAACQPAQDDNAQQQPADAQQQAANAQATQAGVSVTGAWVKLPAVKGRPGAAYFMIDNTGLPATALVSVEAPIAGRTELHESMMEGGAMTMKPLENVAVGAGETLAFAPGGKHVMLFDVSPDVAPGAQVPLTLTFADGTRVTVQALAQGAGDPAPQ